MKSNTKLSNIWLKASVLGCLWASSEIVLGSFLHNMRIPFSSNFLTAIGIILLISVSYIWNEKGLIWRSGLVCALMKSISPSAMIFGPMIAIFSEALLIELSIRVFRRNMFAFLIGGMLAMSWNLFHKIANLIIVYGFNIVNLYDNFAIFAQKQLSIHFDNLWQPILFLWFINLFFGLFASIIGIYIGQKALREPTKIEGINIHKISEIQTKKIDFSFNYSLIWFAFDVLGMIAVLCLMNFTDWPWWSISGVAIIVCWAFRYQRALKPLKKPKFWILFILITMLSSFLFAKFQNTTNGIYEGLVMGVQMNFRAAIMIIGFSTIGTELYNPKIRNFFTRTSFRQLPLALEVAFDTLPYVIANLPSFKKIFTQPVSIIHQMVSQADFWLEKLSVKFKEQQPVIIITGKSEQGKSTLLSEVVDYFSSKKIKIGGFISPSIVENNIRTGNDLIDIATHEKIKLSRINNEPDLVQVGRFYFSYTGIEFAKNILSVENNLQSQLIIIDEVGPWELENQGWASCINDLLLKTETPMIWTVRISIVDKVIENWNLNNYKIFNVTECKSSEIIKYITDNQITSNK